MNRNNTLLIRINDSLKSTIQEIASKNNVSVSDIVNQCLVDIAKKGDLSLAMKSKLGVYGKVLGISNIDVVTIKKCLDEVLEDLKLKEKVKKVYLFGSFARGEATPSSDIDLRFETTNNISMFDIGNIRYYMKEKTGRDIDISNQDVNKLDPLFYKNIKKDEICIYE